MIATADIPTDKIIGTANPKRTLEQESASEDESSSTNKTVDESRIRPSPSTKKPHRDCYGTESDDDQHQWNSSRAITCAQADRTAMEIQTENEATSNANQTPNHIAKVECGSEL